jgi:hypothetical protein
MSEGRVDAGVELSAQGHLARRALEDVMRHLQGRAQKLVGFLLVVSMTCSS